MARGWKRILEAGLARSPLPDWYRRRSHPSAVVLAFHNIVPHGEKVVGDLSLHLDQSRFGRLLDVICETHDVVTLEELFTDRDGTDGRPRAVVTFDDAYVGAVTAGLEELSSRGLPATMFVAPSRLGGDSFWWDALAGEPGAPLSESVRRHCLGVLQGKQARILEWARRQGSGISEVPEHARPSEAEHLLAAASRSRLSLGAHSWSHANLAALSEDECVQELDDSWAWVRNHAPACSEWLAYPYGLASPGVARLAEERFAGALLVEGGHAVVRGRTAGSRFATPRVTVPRDLSPAGLRLRLAGLVS